MSGWVGIAPVLVLPVLAAAIAHLSVRAAYSVASWSLRGGVPEDWVHAARLAHPVRVAHGCGLLVPIACAAMAVQAVGPFSLASPPVMGLLAFGAAYAAVAPIAARTERRLLGLPGPVPGWGRRLAAGWLVKMPVWLVIGAIALLTPAALGWRAATVLLLGGVALFRCAQGDGVRVARALGLVQGSARLQDIVEQTAARMGVAAPRSWVMPSLHAEAYALPSCRALLFSDRALEILPDGELMAICAHEIGHLTEPARVVAARSAVLVWLLPIAGARALIGSLGIGAYLGFVLLFVLFAFARRGWSRRLEERADAAAVAHELEPQGHARALLRIYRMNLLPAVMPGRGGTHPHLYDRLVSAGMTPEWPRPRPPSRRLGSAALLVAMLLTMAGWVSLYTLRGFLRAPEDARRSLQLIALTGGSAAEISDLALARFREGRYTEAEALYRTAADLEPQRPQHRSNLAIVLARLGRCQQASEMAETLPRGAASIARRAAASCR